MSLSETWLTIFLRFVGRLDGGEDGGSMPRALLSFGAACIPDIGPRRRDMVAIVDGRYKSQTRTVREWRE